MPGRTKKSTGAAMERLLKEGRGQGEGAGYQPWVQVTDFPAHSTCCTIDGWKHSRKYHLLSVNGERKYFLVLEWCDDIVEIREQFPLPLHRTAQIARSIGKKHPKEDGRLKVMTTDFLLFVRRDGEIRRVVRTVKLISGLWGANVFSLLEIDRRYWLEEGVDWGLITEANVPEPIWRNVDWLHESRDINKLQPLIPDQIKFIAEYMCEHIDIDSLITLAPFCLGIDRAIGSEHGTALRVAKFLLANKILRFDVTELIETHKPLLISDVRPMGHLWASDGARE